MSDLINQPLFWLALALAFTAGLTAGILGTLSARAIRARYRADERGETGSMSTRTRAALVILGALCLVATTIAVVGNWRGGRQDDQQDRERDADRACIASYNTAAGVARDERAAASSKANAEEKQAYLDLLAQPNLSAEQLVRGGIALRITTLDAIALAQAAAPYPDPRECEDGSYDGPTPTPETP